MIENKNCKKCWISFTFTDEDLEFYNKISPTFNWIRYNIASPTLCHECRQQRRLTWINQRKLYRGICASSGKPILSLYSPDSGYKVYDHKIWRSDQWDALDFGQVFDFSKSFFEQFDNLQKNTPHPNLFIINSENSDFNNSIVDCKNCYMCFGNNELEDAYYVSDSMKTTDSSDIWWSGNVENSYECSSCGNMYKCFYCYESGGCSNSIFLQNCEWCQDCIMCFGLQNAKYHIKNIKYSPEEYEIKKQELNLWNYNNLQEKIEEFQQFLLEKPHNHTTIVNSENSNWGYIFDSKNCKNCFSVTEVTDSKNLYEWWRVTNVQDSTFVYDNEWLMLECNGVFGNSFNVIFSEHVYWGSRNIIYSSNIYSCQDCFWCVWIRSKQHCIFNKQYSKDKYEQLVPKIIEHMKKTWEWGEFFPVAISRFAYNETPAQEYYPLERKENRQDEAISLIEDNWFKYKWLNKDYPVNIPPSMPTISANELMVNISDLSEEYTKQLLNSAILCIETNKPFRFTKSELEFYIKYNIALPRKSPEARHTERMSLRNPRKLFDRECDKCGVEMKSTFSLDRKETVYCQDCYTKEIY